MAARDVVLRYRSSFDAAGAEAAQKANLGVAKSVDVVGESKQKLGKATVDLELKQRKLEGVTKVLATEFANTARAGFSMESAATAGSAAISFLGNTMRFASGPIGALVTIGATLAATFLLTSTKAQETKREIEAVASATEVYSKTLSLLALAGLTSNADQVKAIENAKKLAEQTKTLAEIEHEKAKASAARFIEDTRLAVATTNLTAAQQALGEVNEKVVRDDYEILTARQRVADATNALKKATESQKAAAEIEAIYAKQVQISTVALTAKEGPALRIQQINAQTVENFGAWSAGMEEIDADEMALDQARQQRAESERSRERSLLQMKIGAAQAWAGVAGSLATYLEQTGKASFDTIKGIRYAEAIVHTAAGVANALAQPVPYPVAVAMAASVAAAGAIQIATIASTSPGGGGSISAPSLGGGGAGGGAGGGGGTMLTAPGAGGGGGGGGPVTVNLTIESLNFSALDMDSIPLATLRQIARRFAELISFELNRLGNSLGR